jgi:hypothetical protein
MRNLTILLSDKLQKCWLCHHTFMANSPLVAIGDRVAHPGTKGFKVCHSPAPCIWIGWSLTKGVLSGAQQNSLPRKSETCTRRQDEEWSCLTSRTEFNARTFRDGPHCWSTYQPQRNCQLNPNNLLADRSAPPHFRYLITYALVAMRQNTNQATGQPIQFTFSI